MMAWFSFLYFIFITDLPLWFQGSYTKISQVIIMIQFCTFCENVGGNDVCISSLVTAGDKNAPVTRKCHPLHNECSNEHIFIIFWLYYLKYVTMKRKFKKYITFTWGWPFLVAYKTGGPTELYEGCMTIFSHLF